MAEVDRDGLREIGAERALDTAEQAHGGARVADEMDARDHHLQSAASLSDTSSSALGAERSASPLAGSSSPLVVSGSRTSRPSSRTMRARSASRERGYSSRITASVVRRASSLPSVRKRSASVQRAPEGLSSRARSGSSLGLEPHWKGARLRSEMANAKESAFIDALNR